MINNGANVNSTVTQKCVTLSVLDFAIDFNNNPKIIALLRKHGGKTGEELKAEGKLNTSYSQKSQPWYWWGVCV